MPASVSMPGVSVAPGLTELTRILRSRNSLAHVRANERTAALIAPYTPMPSRPRGAVVDAFRMIEPPSLSSGSAFCTVKTTPLKSTPSW